LKPSFKSTSETSSGLRGVFQFNVDKPQSLSSFEKFQHSAAVKWAATKHWFKAKTNSLKNARSFDEVGHATDSLQDQVAPAGRSLKATLLNKLPGKGLVQIGDRTVSVYGLILIMAFAFVLLLMSLAKPTSRLGGRH